MTIHLFVTFLQLKCCGVRSYRDWINSTWYKDNTDKEVPASCCKSESDKPTCYKRSTFDVTKVYTKVGLTTCKGGFPFSGKCRAIDFLLKCVH